MEYQTVKFSKDDRVATIVLNRPRVLNSISLEMVEEINHILADIEDDQDTKALVIRGEGRAFCTGADMQFLEQALVNPDLLRQQSSMLNSLFFRLEDLPIPVIAVVHGHALAGGLELLLSCDMVIADQDALIGDQHANFGLMGGGGATQRLPRKVGLQRALDLMLTGRWLSGKEAENWGLVLKAVPLDAIDDALEELVAGLRNKSRPGMGWVKRSALRSLDLSLKDGVEFESLCQAQFFATSDNPKEGVRAFKEKRQPEF